MTTRSGPPRTGTWRRRRLAGAAIGAALLGFAALLPAARPLPFDLCVWHRLTGLPCLGCGLTRSICQLMQGDWAGSVAMHPPGPLVALGIALLVLARAVEGATGASIREWAGRAMPGARS